MLPVNNKILTEFYSGQGLGNQLWVYATGVAVARATGLKLKIKSSWRFKGKKFLFLPMGKFSIYLPQSKPRKPIFLRGFKKQFIEKKTIYPDLSLDTTKFDSCIFELNRSTQFYGNFECEKYLSSVKQEIIDLYQVYPPMEVDPNLCIISIRGGDFLGNKTISLPRQYYLNAIEHMKSNKADVEFAIVTDDPQFASQLIPTVRVISRKANSRMGFMHRVPDYEKIQMDFAILQGASSIILGNSSFGWWAAWTNRKANLVLAPRYWQAYNLDSGLWSPGDILTQGWLWLGMDGSISTYEEEKRKLEKNQFHKSFSGSLVTADDWLPGPTKYMFRSKLYKAIKGFQGMIRMP